MRPWIALVILSLVAFTAGRSTAQAATSPARVIEHRVVPTHIVITYQETIAEDALSKDLETFGNQGYELVSVLSMGATPNSLGGKTLQFMLFFKRPR
jgi:hypothetical protein